MLYNLRVVIAALSEWDEEDEELAEDIDERIKEEQDEIEQEKLQPSLPKRRRRKDTEDLDKVMLLLDPKFQEFLHEKDTLVPNY